MNAALLLLTFLCFSQQQDDQSGRLSVPPELERRVAEDKRKAMEREFKEAKKRLEAEEKERIKRPAQIQINAPTDRVGALLVRHMTEAGYQLADEGKYRLMFQRELRGFKAGLGAAMMGGDSPPLWTISYTLTELSGETTVSADMAVIVRKRFGTAGRTDMNKHKESRRNLDALLQAVKYEAEAR